MRLDHLLSREYGAPFEVSDPRSVQEHTGCSARSSERVAGRSADVGLFSTLQLLGATPLHVNNRIQENFNFAEKAKEKPRENKAEERAIGRRASVCASEIEERTSYTEYGVDALALKAEEGRGDRRNVQGELHTSDEP